MQADYGANLHCDTGRLLSGMAFITATFLVALTVGQRTILFFVLLTHSSRLLWPEMPCALQAVG